MINNADIILDEYMNVEEIVEEGAMYVGNESEDTSTSETKNVVCKKEETKWEEGGRTQVMAISLFHVPKVRYP